MRVCVCVPWFPPFTRIKLPGPNVHSAQCGLRSTNLDGHLTNILNIGPGEVYKPQTYDVRQSEIFWCSHPIHWLISNT